MHGVAWTATARSATQGITWASLFIVARLLSPADYGLVGMASVVLNFAQLLAEFGVGTTIIALRDLTENQLREINTLAILLGIAGTLVGVASASSLAAFFDTPALVPVTMVMSLTFLVTAFQAVPVAILQRDMDFKFLAFNEGLQAVSQAVFTVLIAALGGAYWALVLGALLSYLVANVRLVAKRRYGLSRPRAETLKRITGFTWHVLVTRVAGYAFNNADFLIIGKVLGKADLGAYSFAFMTSNLPIRKVSAILMRITPSLFSAVKQDAFSMRRYVRNLSEVVALMTFPFAVGVALTARELLTLALGDRWSGAILPLQILAWVVPFRSIIFVVPQVLLMMGESRAMMWNAVRTLCVLAPSFLVGAYWGIAGVATVWVVVYPFCMLPVLRRMMRKIQMPAGEYFRAIRTPLIAVAIMAAAVYAVELAISAAWPLWSRAAAKVSAGVMAYGLALWRIYPAEKITLWKELIAGMRAAPENAEARAGSFADQGADPR